MKKRIPGIILMIILCLGQFSSAIFAVEDIAGTDGDVLGEMEAEQIIEIDADGADSNEVLFDEHLNNILYGDRQIRAFGAAAREYLNSDASREVYDALRAQILQVADGQRVGTEFVLDNISYTWSAEELGLPSSEPVISAGSFTSAAADALDRKVKSEIETNNIINALLHDCPYEMYWYDKTSKGGTRFYYSARAVKNSRGTNITIRNLRYVLKVADSYQAESSTTVDQSRTNTAKAAAANARNVVNANAGKSDYEKLQSYKQFICDNVSYNNYTKNVRYGDPWQLIYVFDNDPDTNVVCEGYAKAFQYLCDLTRFKNNKIACYTVGGTMVGTLADSGHMWNIVTMEDGQNYLADITNCDDNPLYASRLFLAGSRNGSPNIGYSLKIGRSLNYLYDENCLNLWDSRVLKLAAQDYSPDNGGSNEDKEPDYSGAWANPFYDVSAKNWFYSAVRFVSINGYMNGYSDGRFGPNDNLSRAMMVQILYNINNSGYEPMDSADFSDVAEGAWYEKAVLWASEQGIVTGFADGTFRPKESVTRAQMAVMLWRYAGSPKTSINTLLFDDTYNYTGYALPALQWAVDNGIMSGGANGSLDINGRATRAQIAQILKNYLER